jgi:hypothetical protein
MTDSAKYVEKALADLELIKSEPSLQGWAEVYTNSIEYAYELTEAQVRTLEDAYDRKLRKFIPAGLAG